MTARVVGDLLHKLAADFSKALAEGKVVVHPSSRPPRKLPAPKPPPGSWAMTPLSIAADRRLKATPLHVVIMLGKYRNHTTGESSPSLTRLAADLGIDKRGLYRLIDKAVEWGWLIKYPGGRGRGQRTVFAIVFAKGGPAHPPNEDEKGGAANHPNEAVRGAHTTTLTPGLGWRCKTLKGGSANHLPLNQTLEPDKRTTSYDVVRHHQPRGTRLPAAWRPDADDRAFAEKLGLNSDDVAAEFIDYWTALPGSKATKLDWSKTFRNRCRQLAGRDGRGLGKRKADDLEARTEAILSRIRKPEP